MQPPNDVRNFVHKRIIGAAGGFLSGGFAGAAGGFISGGSSGRSGGQPRTSTALSMPRSLAGSGPPCAPGTRRFPDGHCHSRAKALLFHPGASQGAVPGGQPFADSTGARFGANGGGPYLPSVDVREVRECLPGDVLGRDGFCYSKSDISNKNRAYPKGRKPLGTPGELAALAKAAAFGRRMETTVKRMQKIGVLKKPTKSRRALPAPRRSLPPIRGGSLTVIDTE